MAVVGNPALCRATDGRLWEAFCINGRVCVRHQITVGGVMSSWSNIQNNTPAGDLDHVAIECNADGRIEVHAVSTLPGFAGVLYGAWQAAAGVTQPFGAFQQV